MQIKYSSMQIPLKSSLGIFSAAAQNAADDIRITNGPSAITASMFSVHANWLKFAFLTLHLKNDTGYVRAVIIFWMSRRPQTEFFCLGREWNRKTKQS